MNALTKFALAPLLAASVFVRPRVLPNPSHGCAEPQCEHQS